MVDYDLKRDVVVMMMMMVLMEMIVDMAEVDTDAMLIGDDDDDADMANLVRYRCATVPGS